MAFDINGDGAEDQIGWVFAEGADAFLWLDLNGNGLVDHGGELFGTSTRLPPGGFARNGFEALAVYDRRDFGGNEDGRISSHDVIWESLGLWKDRNHDGLSQPTELSDLRASPVESIGLAYIGLRRGEGLDGHGNFHAYRGTFIARIDSLGTTFQRRLVIDDVIFVLTHDHSHPREKGD